MKRQVVGLPLFLYVRFQKRNPQLATFIENGFLVLMAEEYNKSFPDAEC